MKRTITKIEAKPKIVTKSKVAAYARVSTSSDEQYTSYEAQVNYYKEYIQGRLDWEFVTVYADEGITGTSTKRRVGFNKMIKDALDGKINLIITKSISRFARNTLDTISYVRKLKEKGVRFFLKRKICGRLILKVN
jgi:site-specific DNA recombinase